MLEIEGIILAAGLSTRLPGNNKLLVKIADATLISRVISQCLNSRLSRLIIVTGPSLDMEEELSPWSGNQRLKIVVNLQPEWGMSSSLRVGINAVKSEAAAAAAIILGDQIFLTSAIINRLWEKFQEHPEKIVAPFVSGRRTTPVIFPSRFFPDLLQTSGDEGGRTVLIRHEESVVGVEMGTMYDDVDLDTPEDLEFIRNRFELTDG
jgi:molybdenum cofactor cytidylyltransferase